MFSHDAPGAWPVLIPGARLAGFIKRTLIHSYTQNRKTLGLEVSETTIFLFCFSHCKSLGANDPRGGAICDPRGMAGRIYKDDHYTLPHTNVKALGLVVFFCFSHDDPKAWPLWTPGARLAGFIKSTTIHCYIQNMKALCLVVSAKKIYFMFFPL